MVLVLTNRYICSAIAIELLIHMTGMINDHGLVNTV